MIKINGKEYEVIKDDDKIINEEELKEKITEYYDDFTYIIGDIAYNKLRLKGFYDDNDKRCKKFNSIKYLDDYLKNYCAYGCKWFEIKRIDKK